MVLKLATLAAWALFMFLFALRGRFKLNGRSLNLFYGLLLGPVFAVAFGMLLMIVGASLSIPIWIWFIPFP
jgi:hypothetical protein